MNQEELNLIFESHRKWLEGEEGGIHTDFSGADLRRARFIGAKLSKCQL